MKDSLLASKEWCDLVFEGRNKEYGAYQLRKTAGRRYRFAAMVIGGCFLVLALVAAVTGWFAYRAIQRTIEEVQEVVHMKPLKDPEVKRISTGRRAVANASPDAKTGTPEMTEEQVVSKPTGIVGPDDKVFVTESTLEDQDMFHNADKKDLPVEGPQLVKTDIVEGRPLFPGGDKALMQWLDAHVIYSSSAVRQKLEGDVEVAFIIDEEGNVIEPEIIKHLNPTLDRAVMQAIQQMPKWSPGTLRGKPTCTKISIPVHFQLK